MKKLLISGLILMSFTAFSNGMPNFEGVYSSIECKKLHANNNYTPSDMFIEISRSKKITITQTDDYVMIDGDTEYWNASPKIYLRSLEDLDSIVKLKKKKISKSGVYLKYKITDGYVGETSTDLNYVYLTKIDDDKFRLKLTTSFKNYFSFGRWKRTTEIDCILFGKD